MTANSAPVASPTATAPQSHGAGHPPHKGPLTEQEQAAGLKEMRAALGPIGGPLDVAFRKAGEPEGLTDACLLRWLVARKGDVQHALRDLNAHIEWRKESTPHGRIPESAVTEHLAHGKVYIQGLDRRGRPVVLGKGSNHIKFPTKEYAKLFCTYALDAAVDYGNMANPQWDGKLTGVFDLRNLGLKQLDFTAMGTMFDLLQNHYPERLGHLYLYCAPKIFYGLWRMCQPFVDPVTKTKIHFVYEQEAEKIFSEDFDPEVLPKDLHGAGEWRFMDKVMVAEIVPLLEKLDHEHPPTGAAAAPAAANGTKDHENPPTGAAVVPAVESGTKDTPALTS